MSPGWALVLVVALIAANGLFVAAEFALISVRRSRLELRAERGERRAKVALAELDRASVMLSGVQFGITATSLVVGFLAESAVGDAIIRPILDLFSLAEETAGPLSLTLAFILSTIAQMLLGELAPKNLALAIPEKMSLAVAYPIRIFGRAFGPVIALFDGAAAWVTERVFRVEVAEERHGGYSPEELERIITLSKAEGALAADQADLLGRAVGLGDRRARAVMVPWTRVRFLRGDDTADELVEAARESGHSRFPVVGESEDDVLGTVHIKDLLGIPAPQRPAASLAELVEPALIVPESDRLRLLLRKLREERRTFAVVADEYGAVAGIVTVEDILEELVGEIEDEFDTDPAPIRALGRGGWSVDGSCTIDERYRQPVLGRIRFMLAPAALIDLIAVAVAGLDDILVVELENDVAAVIDVARYDPIDVLFDPPPKRIVPVFGKRRVGEVNADQLVLGIMGVGGNIAGAVSADFPCLGLKIAVGIIGVAEIVVLEQAVGVVVYVGQ